MTRITPVFSGLLETRSGTNCIWLVKDQPIELNDVQLALYNERVPGMPVPVVEEPVARKRKKRDSE